MNLTAFDFVALIVIGVFAVMGLRKGLIAEVFKILGIIVGIILALQYVQQGAAIIHSFAAMDPQVEKVLSFIIILLVTMGVSIFLAKLTRKIFKVVLLGWVDKTGGLLFGSLKGALIISAFLPLFMFLPDSISLVKETKQKSFAFKYLNGFAPMVYNSISSIIPGADDFASKITDAFPGTGSLEKLSGGGMEPDQLNMMKSLMGSGDNPSLDEVQKILGGGADIKQVDMKEINKLMDDQRKKLEKGNQKRKR